MSDNSFRSTKKRIFDVIQIGNRGDTLSKFMDWLIVINIVVNIVCMFLETFDELAPYSGILRTLETITIFFFCVEYALRIWTAEFLYPKLSRKQAVLHFLYSFDGIVDLLTILPFFFLSGFVVFRMLRVVRIFHLFRLNVRYDSFNVITSVLMEKRTQIISSVFIILVLMFGSSLCIYSAEHDAQPEVFRNAFSGIWWSMSTLLTIGYGDIYPITILGRIMATIIAFLGVGVVAIPTGIISAGFVEQYSKMKNSDAGGRSIASTNILILDISSHHPLCGKTLDKVGLPYGLQIVTLIRNGLSLTADDPTQTISVGDRLIISAVSDDTDRDSGIRFMEVLIDQDHSWAHHAVSQLDISRLTTVIAINRNGSVITPQGNTEILPGDRVTLSTTSGRDQTVV